MAGAAILVACGQYFVAEAVASFAWREPSYHYLTNYISDLGIVGCTARMCSPLAVVMNAGFVIAGVLCILAAVILASFVRPGAARHAVLLLAGVHGIGSMIVGVVHSAPGTTAGTPRAHLIGAYMAIIGGNLGLMLLGAVVRASGPFRVFSIAFGAVGLGSGVALVLTQTAYPGLLERIAADTIPFWEVSTGLALLALGFRQRGFLDREGR